MNSPTADLRYPVGKFAFSGTWSGADRAAAIEAIAALPKSLSAAVAGLSEGQLDTPYRPGGWTVRQTVHHVADSHINAYCRFRFALTETAPTIKPYNESDWAGLVDARTAPVSLSLSLLEGLHARWLLLLKSLAPDQFARTLMHPENGVMTLDKLLALYAWHSAHHTAHITALRAREHF
jgi:uncharacterized damage-inducible protein DinB